jgi:hypothetical protein
VPLADVSVCLLIGIRMKRILSVVICWSVLIASVHAETALQKDGIFLGLHHSNKDWPIGCEHLGGGVIQGNNFEGAVSQWICHGKRYLVLDRLTHRDDKGIPYWEVLDFKILPDLRKGEIVSDDADNCSNPSGGYTLAISKWKASKYKSFAYDITFALRLNMDSLKLELVKPKSVKCEYNDDRD